MRVRGLVCMMAVAASLAACRRPSGSNERSAGPLPGIFQRAGEAVRGPQVIVDQDIAVSASSFQAQPLSIPSARRVKVLTEGLKHADKGFSVYLVPAYEIDNVKNGKGFQHAPSFQGVKVRAFTHTDEVPAGSWYVVVMNSENIFNTMVVHLKIVTDPD